MFFVVVTILICAAYLCFTIILHRGWSILHSHDVCQKTPVSATIVMVFRHLGIERLAKWEKNMSGQSIEVPTMVGNDDLWRIGKKKALHRVMSNVSTPFALLTDGDTSVSLRWAEAVTSACGGNDLLLLPVRMGVDCDAKGWQALWQRVQALEFASLVGSGMAMCGIGHPIMCNGAGMLVNTKRWLESWQDLHPEIPSGDDIFLLHSFKRRKLLIDYATGHDTVVSTEPNRTVADFWRQRTRWTSKAGAYSDRDTIAVGAFVAIVNLLWVITLCRPLCFLFFWLVKSLADYTFLRRLKILYHDGYTLSLTLLINLFYPLYALITPIAGILKRKNW